MYMQACMYCIRIYIYFKKIPDPSIHLSNNSSSTTFTYDASVRNLGVTVDPHLSFSNHISNLSRPPLLHAQPVTSIRRIRPMLDSKTASTIATSIVYSKLDYCNSLFLNLDSTQNLIQRLQLIQNSLARVVTIERPGISSYYSCP